MYMQIIQIWTLLPNEINHKNMSQFHQRQCTFGIIAYYAAFLVMKCVANGITSSWTSTSTRHTLFRPCKHGVHGMFLACPVHVHHTIQNLMGPGYRMLQSLHECTSSNWVKIIQCHVKKLIIHKNVLNNFFLNYQYLLITMNKSLMSDHSQVFFTWYEKANKYDTGFI